MTVMDGGQPLSDAKRISDPEELARLIHQDRHPEWEMHSERCFCRVVAGMRLARVEAQRLNIRSPKVAPARTSPNIRSILSLP